MDLNLIVPVVIKSFNQPDRIAHLDVPPQVEFETTYNRLCIGCADINFQAQEFRYQVGLANHYLTPYNLDRVSEEDRNVVRLLKSNIASWIKYGLPTRAKYKPYEKRFWTTIEKLTKNRLEFLFIKEMNFSWNKKLATSDIGVLLL